MDRQVGRSVLAEIQRNGKRLYQSLRASKTHWYGLQLTGGPRKDELDRASLDLFNNLVAIGNGELIYTIASTPEFNVGRFEYAEQYEFLSKRMSLLKSGTAAAVP
jgi:hypothetical protein